MDTTRVAQPMGLAVHRKEKEKSSHLKGVGFRGHNTADVCFFLCRATLYKAPTGLVLISCRVGIGRCCFLCDVFPIVVPRSRIALFFLRQFSFETPREKLA